MEELRYPLTWEPWLGEDFYVLKIKKKPIAEVYWVKEDGKLTWKAVAFAIVNHSSRHDTLEDAKKALLDAFFSFGD